MTIRGGWRGVSAMTLVLAGVLALSAAGCGGNNTGDQSTSAAGTEGTAGGGAGQYAGPGGGAAAAGGGGAPVPMKATTTMSATQMQEEQERQQEEATQAARGGGRRSLNRHRDSSMDTASLAPGAGGAFGGAGAAAAPVHVAPPRDKTMPPQRRRDPFAPWWDTNPAPPVLSMVQPVVLVPPTVGQKPPAEHNVQIQEPPTLRVSGIMTGTGVYALLEGPEGQVVVKPGDSVGAYRVDAIRPSAVVLKRQVGHVTYTMVAPLSEAGAGAGAYGGGYASPGVATP